MLFLKKFLSRFNAITAIDKNNRFPFLKKWLTGHPQLWHFNRHSVARGFSVGLFAAVMPLPCQMIIAALLAIVVKGNMLAAMLATWISNPITMIFFIYLIYQTGAWLSGSPALLPSPHFSHFKEFSFDKIDVHHFYVLLDYSKTWIRALGKNFFIGLPVVAVSLAIIGYFLVYIIWYSVILIQARHRLKRRERKKL